MNSPYKIIRVVVDAGLPSTPKKPQASLLVQNVTSRSSGMSKAAAPSTNVEKYNFIQSKFVLR